MTELSSFAGKTVLITGGSSGIGAATAQRFASAGAEIHLVGRSERVFSTAARLQNSGASVSPSQIDVADAASMARCYEAAAAKTGKIDVAVHAAGVGFPGTIQGSDPEVFEKVIGANLLGTMYGSQLALNHMVAGGLIVNVSSVSGRIPSAMGSYVASKFGVTGFTESLRMEASRLGIRVTCLEPGRVSSKFYRHLSETDQANVSDEPSLASVDVAECIYHVSTLPAHVNIGELVVRHVRQMV